MNDTIQFLSALCEQADKERSQGNWQTMGVIASVPALQYFFDNYHKMGVNAASFAHIGLFQQAKAFHEAYKADEKQRETVVESAQRLDTLEGKVDQLIALITPLVEQATEDDAEPEEEPKPRKRARKSAGKTEPAEPAAEPDAGEDSEDESEADSE